MQYERTMARIGVQLLRCFQVEIKVNVIIDGRIPWIQASTEHLLDVPVNSQKTKTAIWRMQYERTVARIGLQLPRWFRVELNNSVVTYGRTWGVVPSKSEAALELAFPLGGYVVEWMR
jgi:hypothetical protein